MINIEEILRRSHRILLVDWPDLTVPRQLLEAGFEVFGVSPKGYTRANLSSHLQEDSERDVEFQRLDRTPEQVDIVHVYRPAEELGQIIKSQVDQTGTRVFWLQPPIRSDAARGLCAQRKIDFVEGVDIVETIQRLGIRK